MGGFIGKLSFEQDETLARPVLEQMLESVAHRGTAARGIYCGPGLALGWCTAPDEQAPPARLAANERQNIRAVSDSRLDNAPELRRQLEREGHAFRGHSDAELIAHAYEQWGKRCVERFRGPFAFALWDEGERRLLLARDHVGVRPCFFALLYGHGVVFASELRTLFHDPGVSREWCPTAIDAYLALGYVPAPLTAFRRVSKLEPAQIVVVEGRRLHAEQYWDLPPIAAAPSAGEAASAADHRLRSAVRAQARDGRVNGTLYSGGTASSALLSVVPSAAGDAITMAFEQDTTEVARSHAAGLQLGHPPHIEVATPDMGVLASELAAQFDEPIADPSAVSQYALCVAARQHSDCALAGHGASALWAGYGRSGMPLGSAAWANGTEDFWDGPRRRALYTRGFAWEVRDANPFARHLELAATRRGAEPADRALYVDTRTFLPDSVLAVAQRAAMAVGLRLRFPFLDREFVEFSATVPARSKHNGAAGMLALREMLARRLPASLQPPAERGPEPHAWLRAAVNGMVPRVLLAPRFDGRGVISRPALQQLWDEHRTRRRDHGHRLWSLLVLEFWFRESIDGDVAEEPAEYALLLKAA